MLLPRLLIPTFFVLTRSEDAFDTHLQKGKVLFAKRQYTNALAEFHSALDLNPKHSEALFRRATCYQSLNRYIAALKDLDLLIEVRPTNTVAYKQKAAIFLKRGMFDEAEKAFKKTLELDPSDSSVETSLSEVQMYRSQVKAAVEIYESGDFERAKDILGHLVETLHWDCRLLKMNAITKSELGEVGQALQSLLLASNVCPDDESMYVTSSDLSYSRGDIDEAISSIRQCLKINPDSKTCNPVYKKLRKFIKDFDKMRKLKDGQDWDKCVQKGSEILEKQFADIEKSIVLKSRCLCHKMAENFDKALSDCNAAMEVLGETTELLLLRAEVNIELESYDEAHADYDTILKTESANEDAKAGKETVEKARRNERERDYYKILGVSRSASKREITKAYRKLAQKWHPDNFTSEDEKKRAEKKFIDIAAAKEVLSDDEKRRRFDHGDDPLKSDGGRPHHQHFYGDGSSFFGGHFDPSQFNFHFE